MTRHLGLAGVVVVVATGWILLLPPAPVAQPIAFSHAKHAALACAVCHRGAETAARADLPAASLCAKCHAAIPGGATSPAAGDFGQNRSIGWVRVTRVPDHTIFSHRRHVALGNLTCASCHADIGRRAVPPGRQPIRLDMETCLACHTREGASEDCAACHR